MKNNILTEKREMNDKLVWAIARNASHRRDSENRNNKIRNLIIVFFFALLFVSVGLYFMGGLFSSNVTGNAVLDNGNVLISEDTPASTSDNIVVQNEQGIFSKLSYIMNSFSATDSATFDTNTDTPKLSSPIKSSSGGYGIASSTAPDINFTYPTENNATYLTRNNIVVNVSVTGDNIANITIWLYNSTGLYNISNSTINSFFLNFTDLPGDTYTFNASIINMTDNINYTETRTVFVPTLLTSCTTLDRTGGYYILTSNVWLNGTCFNVTRNSIIFDGLGYTVNYSTNGSKGWGFNLTNVNYTTIKNTKIREGRAITYTAANAQIDAAITLHRSNNNTITNNTIYTFGTAANGIIIYGNSSSNNISFNNISLAGSDVYGVEIGSYDTGNINSRFNIVNNNNITLISGITVGRTPLGIYIYLSNFTNITSNTIRTTANGWAYGLRDIGDNSYIAKNNITAGCPAIDAQSSTALIEYNTVSSGSCSAGSFNYGIYGRVPFTRIYSNQISSSLYGIYLDGGGTLFNNTIKTNNVGAYGIYINRVGNVNLSSNYINTSNEMSIFIWQTDATNYRNISIENTNLVEGKPVNYTYSVNNTVLNNMDYSGYGQTIFVYCNNITLNNTMFNYDGLLLINSNNFTINNVTVNGTLAPAITLDDSDQNTISNSFIKSNCSFCYGINSRVLNGVSKYNKIFNNVIATTGGAAYGIYLYTAADSWNISSNNINTSQTMGIYCSNSVGTIIHSNIVNSTTNSYAPIYLSTCTFTNITSNTIYSGTSTHGISASSSSGLIKDNNIFSTANNNYNAIHMASSDAFNVISNNITFGYAGAYGIYDSVSCNGCNFTYNNLTAIGSTNRGIYSTSNDVNISYNLMKNMNLSGITIGGNRQFVSNNEIYGIYSSYTSLFTMSFGLKNALVVNNRIHGQGAAGGLSGYSTNTTFKNNYYNKSINSFYSVGNTFVQFYDSTNLTFINESFYSYNASVNVTGLLISNVYNVNFTMYNSIINISNETAFDFLNSKAVSGYFNLTNVTKGNGTAISVAWGVGANGTLNMHWWLDSLSNHTNSTLLSNVNVSGYDNLNRLVFNQNTNSNGRTSTVGLLEYIRNGTGGATSTYYSNYTFNANYSTENLSQSWNMTTSRDLNFLFGIDITVPAINFSYPTENNNSYLNRNNILINVTSEDPNLQNIAIYLYNTTSLVNNTNTSTSPNFVNITGLPDSNYLFNATSYDIAGNLNYTETRNIAIETTAPIISILSPLNNSYSLNNTLIVSYSVYDIYINLCWYSNDSYVANVTLTDCGTNITGLTWTEGQHNVTIWANDTFNNVNSTYIRFFIDTIVPGISITSPTNNTNSSDNGLDVKYVVSDSGVGLSNCWYSNDTYAANVTLTCGTNITTVTWTEGQHNVTIWANDTLNNINKTNVRFFIDTINPLVSIIYPENITYTANISELNYTVYDLNLMSCWYSLDLGVTNTTISCGVNLTDLTSIEGTNSWKVYANDSTGNSNFSSVTFFKDTIFSLFYNISNNNGTIQGSGTAIFNVSVENTNGTVILQLNNTNYTASNSSNVYNVSVSLTTGTYSYYWLAYGSGSLNNYNTSEIKYYTIKEAAPTPTPSPGSGGGGGGGHSSKNKIEEYECTTSSQCNPDYTCFNHECVKLFDVKILKSQSILQPKQTFNITYFIKGMANISGDVTIKFFLKQNDEKISLGQDVIYLGSFESKTKSTEIYLPKDIKTGTYDFYVQVNFEDYSAESFRKVDIELNGDEIILKEAVTEMPANIQEIVQKKIENNYILLSIILILSILIILLARFIRKKRKLGFKFFYIF